MLWLCLHFPHLPIELRQPADQGVVAIAERKGNHRLILASNTAARAAGIHASLDVTIALARDPSLRIVDRTESQETLALKALASCAYQWSGDVSIDAKRWLVGLEVAASVRYFNGLAALTEQLTASVVSLGYTPQMGIAPTWEAAALFASSARPVTVEDMPAIKRELLSRPITDLVAPATTLEKLQTAGLRTIGEVLDIPRDALARRFGGTFTDYLKRLLGERPDPRKRFRMPTRYQRTFECPYVIDTMEALLFPLRRVLQELQGYLRGRDVAVESVFILLQHRVGPATRLELRTSTPQRDAARLFPLLKEQLERTALPAPVLQVVVKADHFVAPVITQKDLFDEPKAYDLEWSQLLDRLRARLGDNAIRELHLADDFRPEYAWCIAHRDFEEDANNPLPERPVWILDPKPLRTLPKLLGDPERIEAGWWDAGDSHRDYYVAETPEGALWWIYRDGPSKEWYLHGIWA